jgi:hypothetical protein
MLKRIFHFLRAVGAPSQLKIHFNRFDGRVALVQLRAGSVGSRSDGSFIEVKLDPTYEFEILFPTSDVIGTGRYLELAREVLENLAEFDNAVQSWCAAECARSGLHPRNFEGIPAYCRLQPDSVVFRYWGTGVNTEWDERFVRVDGRWFIGVRRVNRD